MPLTRLPVRESTRDQENIDIVFRQDLADRVLADPSLKAMVYCAADPITPYTLADIAFPHQVEIKVNEDEVKANLRGLKNKPGSTRPADITKLLRIRANFRNQMKVTYALTQKVSEHNSLVHPLSLTAEPPEYLFTGALCLFIRLIS